MIKYNRSKLQIILFETNFFLINKIISFYKIQNQLAATGQNSKYQFTVISELDLGFN